MAPTDPTPPPQGRELVEGQILVTAPTGEVKVVVPAGVGIPGLDDVTLAEELVAVLLDADVAIPEVLDVAQEAARRPGLLAAIEARIDAG